MCVLVRMDSSRCAIKCCERDVAPRSNVDLPSFEALDRHVHEAHGNRVSDKARTHSFCVFLVSLCLLSVLACPRRWHAQFVTHFNAEPDILLRAASATRTTV